MAIVSKSDVVTRFNTIVRNPQPSMSAASWYSGSAPSYIASSSDLGPRAEAVMTVAEIPGPALASTVFNILHNFAQRLTRVRRARYVWVYNSGPSITPGYTVSGYSMTALNEGLALHFAIPTQPNPGDLVEDATFNAFLTSLYNEVRARRTGVQYSHTIFACHSSCHSSCHGSRGRR